MKEKRESKRQKVSRKVAEQISLINRLYEKKEFDAKQAYYKKQLDALKKFESDRQNVIQTTDQRKIENSTTMAENKMNKEWKPNDEKQFLNFAQTQANLQTSSPYSIADDEMYDKFLHTIEYARQLIVVMDEIQVK